ncbi:beta-N-acetylhexosaminidase [Ornithinibacillus gellani]|uniref:beta-N-acetylhexosaminidase n=1 Tax=Ornithinibacillus gellani TaxID=2293253 RepID=UPI000F48EC3F|nr:beta-N-acetylhexosaminidase [Ornithinibacillus gellani]TQS70987.1 beta-N-acetylhexosaminidase [Ornithinibacillus gellani]
MVKKVGLSLAIILIILVTLDIFVDRDFDQPQSSLNQPNDENKQQDNHSINRESSEELIYQIFSKAEAGEVNESPFQVEKTDIQEVVTRWGEPVKTNEIDNRYYAEYDNQYVHIGYQNQLIFDIRSYAPSLQAIHFNDIIGTKGEPDEINFYQDTNVDQIILIYQVNEMFQLKWIFPKPTETDQNPVLHHISVTSGLDDSIDSVSEEIAALSLDEKIGQLLISGIDQTTTSDFTDKLLHEYHVGGIIFFSENLETTEQSVALMNQLKKDNAENKYPLFLSIDQEGGEVSRLPEEIRALPTAKEIGLRNSPSYAYQMGVLLGKQLKLFGFNLNFAPVLDIYSNPANTVIGNRAFGEDAETVGKIGIQEMKGIQTQQVIPVVKHFPGHGDTETDSHEGLPVVEKSLQELQELELQPFQEAIEKGAEAMMVAHIMLNEIDPEWPASLSNQVIQDLLREKLGFKGLVITDDLTMGAIVNQYDIGAAAVKSIQAGSDIVLVAHEEAAVDAVFYSLKHAVEAGEITEKRIDESLQRIISLKKKYGMHHNSIPAVDVEELNQTIDQVMK